MSLFAYGQAGAGVLAGGGGMRCRSAPYMSEFLSWANRAIMLVSYRLGSEADPIDLREL